MFPRTLAMTAMATLAAGAAWAQPTGSMEVRVGGDDRTFTILGEESAVEFRGAGDRVMTLVAAPDTDSKRERLTLVFAVEGLGTEASVGEQRITYLDAAGAAYAPGEDMVSSVSLSSLSEIGGTLIVSGTFSSEMAPEGDGDPLGVSGTFQATVEPEEGGGAEAPAEG